MRISLDKQATQPCHERTEADPTSAVLTDLIEHGGPYPSLVVIHGKSLAPREPKMLMHRQPTATDAGRQPQNWSGGIPAYALRACPRDAPEQPSTANDRHQQQLANMKLARAFRPASRAREHPRNA